MSSTTMPTLILPPRYTPDSIALWKAATAMGWRVERLSSWRVPDWLKSRDVVFYGEPLLAAAIGPALSLAMLGPPPDWLTTVPSHYRKRDVRFATLADARGMESPHFVKPALEKCFVAKVYQSGVELPGLDVLPDETPVLIAEPVAWEVEFRCFILERRILTISPYMVIGELAQNADGCWSVGESELEDASEFTTAVLADAAIGLPAAVVVDVGRIAARGWAVIEANAAWGSGIYGCDPAAVLQVIQRACVPKSTLTKGDSIWIAGA